MILTYVTLLANSFRLTANPPGKPMLQHGLCPGQTLWSHKSDMLGLSTGEAQALCRRKKSMSEALESLLDMPGLNRMRNWLHSCVGHLN